MPEPDFHNFTPFTAELLPYVDAQGYECRLVVMKASYALGSGPGQPLLDEQRPIRLGDEPWGDPEMPDNKFPTDLCSFKPGTDFLVCGHAISPNGRGAWYIDVLASCAGRTRRLRAHGPRRWMLNMMSQVTLGESEPAERVPMCWRLAYGGFDAADPTKPVECRENPAGLGVARDPLLLRDKPAPQIEDIDQPIRSPNQGIKPAGLGPLGPLFEPRRTLAGTYDKTWLEHIHPAKPRDYSPGFENVAPREFVFDTPLHGREVGVVQGMTPEGSLPFEVPLERPFVEWKLDGKLERKEPHLDTVLIDTDEKVLELVWRVSIRCPSKMRNRFTEVEVFKKEVLTR
jgi:hypothetical protein